MYCSVIAPSNLYSGTGEKKTERDVRAFYKPCRGASPAPGLVSGLGVLTHSWSRSNRLYHRRKIGNKCLCEPLITVDCYLLKKIMRQTELVLLETVS
jgi:hypothetical protein